MAKVHPAITPELASFIEEQPLFFVASAPREGGHVNLSPKGLDCLRVLEGDEVAYLDLTGSGNETAAHLLDNGRITFMFCSFSGSPRILRLFGAGRVLQPETSRFDELIQLFPSYPGSRQIIHATITRVQTSCGFAVPRLELVGQRDTLIRWAENRGPEELEEYRRQHNTTSIDGLPAPAPANLPAR